MQLFASTQMSWEEPYFFIVRLFEAWGWRRRALLFAAITAAMFVAIHFARIPQFAIGKTLPLSLASVEVLLLLLDVGNIQRVHAKLDGRCRDLRGYTSFIHVRKNRSRKRDALDKNDRDAHWVKVRDDCLTPISRRLRIRSLPSNE